MEKARRKKRSGNVVVMIVVLMPILAGMGAFAIDVGYIEYSRSRLQASADAAALAAELAENEGPFDALALQYAQYNVPSGMNLDVAVEVGQWDDQSSAFAPGNVSQANAVRVTVQSFDTALFFGMLLGKSFVDISASAIATVPSSNIGSRFLIDDEMIDKDVPAIEDLANDLGVDAEELVTARGFNQGKEYNDSNWTWEDNFLDLPAGETLSLPTGQGTDYDNNDAGIFDIDNPDFPFTSDQDFADYLMYSESGNDPSKWGSDYDHILNQLDPLVGVAPVTDENVYDSFVDPNYVHVSPVTYSDVSTLDMQSGVPQVNAKGLRRGLIAFKIIAVGVDPDGSGSILPELVVEIVDPSTIDLDDIVSIWDMGNSCSGTWVTVLPHSVTLSWCH